MYRRTLVSRVLMPTTRRRRRPTAAAPASGANTFQEGGRITWHYPENIPRVQGVAPAGRDAVILTLANGEQVTMTAVRGTCMHPDGLLVANCHALDSPAYLLTSPALIWEAKARLGLYSQQADHREWDAYLLSLPVVTEACVIDDVLTLVCMGPDGRPGLQQFTGELTVQFGRHEPGLDFTRFPLTMTLIEGHGEDRKVYALRVDHTPEGYAVLRTLGWDAPLPDLGQAERSS